MTNMSRKTIIRLIIILCCIGLTIWQIPNLTAIWHIYASAKKLQITEDDLFPTLKKPLFSPKVRQTDPIAADVAEYLAAEDFNELTAFALKYPDNPFFMVSLATSILPSYNTSAWNGLNPKIASLIAKKLINTDPNNAHFHYLAAYTTLLNMQDNDYAPFLTAIERGNNCSHLTPAGDSYHQRIMALCVKEHNPFAFSQLNFWSERDFYIDIYKTILGMADSAVTHANYKFTLYILQSGEKFADQYIKNAKTSNELFRGNSVSAKINEFQIRHFDFLNIDPQKIRFDLSKTKVIHNILIEIMNKSDSQYPRLNLIILVSTFAVVFALCFLFSLLFYIFVFLFKLIRKKPENICKIKWYEYLLFPASLIIFYILAVFFNDALTTPAFLSEYLPCRMYENTSFLLVITSVLWLCFWLTSMLNPYKKPFLLFGTKRALFFLALSIAIGLSIFFNIISPQDILLPLIISFSITVALWLILMFGWWFTKNRIVQLLLLIVFLAGLFNLHDDLVWIKICANILLVVFAAIIIAGSPSEKIPTIIAFPLTFFGKTESIATSRLRILKLLQPYLLVFFISFLAGIYFSCYMMRERINQSIKLEQIDNFKPFPPANERTYHALVTKILNSASDRLGNPRYLLFSEPNDFPKLFTKSNRTEPDEAKEDELRRLLKESPPDLRNTIVNLLKNPNSNEAIIARAAAGDKTLKPQLQKIFEQKLSALAIHDYNNIDRDNFPAANRPENIFSDCVQAAVALARFSEPNEASQRFMNIIKNCDSAISKNNNLFAPGMFIVPDAIHYNSSEFFKGLNSLPCPRATQVLKAYLDKTKYDDITSGNAYASYDIENCLAKFADTEIAENIFKLMCGTELLTKPVLSPNFSALNKIAKELQMPQQAASQLRLVISPHLNEHSIPLLKNALNTDDANLRAYCVWQLTKAGYKWPQDELEKLFNDKSWKVRANTALASPQQAKVFLKNDKNDFVKITLNLINN